MSPFDAYVVGILFLAVLVIVADVVEMQRPRLGTPGGVDVSRVPRPDGTLEVRLRGEGAGPAPEPEVRVVNQAA